jgi:hypothetical protein
MKKIALLAALAFAASGWAQPAKEPAKEAAKPAAAQETAKPEAAQPEAAKPEPQKRVAKKANPRRQEDARHCLEKSTNTEVIKCAEAYL